MRRGALLPLLAATAYGVVFQQHEAIASQAAQPTDRDVVEAEQNLAAKKGHGTTPVEKVVTLLTKLRVQIQTEGTEEAAGYDKYACFCKEQADNKIHAIDKSTEIINKLDAEITALQGDITQMDSDVVTAKGKVDAEEIQAKTKNGIRAQEHSAYVNASLNLTEGIEVIESAIVALQQSRKDIENTDLVQLDQKLQSHIGISLLGSHRGPGDAPTYEAKDTNEMLDVLRDLLRTFKREKADLDEQEENSRFAHGMVEVARKNRMKALNDEVELKEKISAFKMEQKSEKKGLLEDETDAKVKDQAFLDDLTSNCETKATHWDQRSKTRASEITAITECLGELEGMEDSYEVNKKLVGLISKSQVKVQPSFLQSGLKRRISDSKLDAELRKVLGEHLSAQLLDASSSGAPSPAVEPDRFMRVRDLIKDLIARLEQDALDEATQKSFCDKEMKSGVTKRDAQAEEMEQNSANIYSTKGDISNLEAEIKELSEEIAALYKAKKEMEDLRKDEKARNDKAVIDADAAALAVGNAIQILENFYTFIQESGAAPAPAGPWEPKDGDRFGRTVSDLAPETFEGEYHGKKTESKGIIGLLEVIKSDFERTSAATTQAETDALSDYNTQISKIDGEISAKEKREGTAKSDKGTKEGDLVGFEDDFDDAKKLHGEAKDQLDKLKASCVDAEESYEERVEARKKEIQALKEAHNMLENWEN